MRAALPGRASRGTAPDSTSGETGRRMRRCGKRWTSAPHPRTSMGPSAIPPVPGAGLPRRLFHRSAESAGAPLTGLTRGRPAEEPRSTPLDRGPLAERRRRASHGQAPRRPHAGSRAAERRAAWRHRSRGVQREWAGQRVTRSRAARPRKAAVGDRRSEGEARRSAAATAASQPPPGCRPPRGRTSHPARFSPPGGGCRSSR